MISTRGDAVRIRRRPGDEDAQDLVADLVRSVVERPHLGERRGPSREQPEVDTGPRRVLQRSEGVGHVGAGQIVGEPGWQGSRRAHAVGQLAWNEQRAGERRAAEELRSGDEDHAAALDVRHDRVLVDAHLRGVDHHVEPIAFAFLPARDGLGARQADTRLGSFDDVQQHAVG